MGLQMVLQSATLSQYTAEAAGVQGLRLTVATSSSLLLCLLHAPRLTAADSSPRSQSASSARVSQKCGDAPYSSAVRIRPRRGRRISDCAK
jgi:hypothetical protein